MNPQAIAFGAFVVLVMFSGPIASLVKRGYSYVKSRVPSLGDGAKGILSASVTIPIWKALVLVLGAWVFLGGATWQGCTLPELPVMPWLIPGGAPISEPGFRVLMTYDESNRGNLTAGQKQIYDSTAIPAYLDAHCVKDSTNAAEWRLWPDSETPREDQPIWQKLMAIAKGKGQWVVISNGRTGTSQPWPADEAAMLALLKKYGGA